MIKVLLAAGVLVVIDAIICHAQSRAISKAEYSLITNSYGQILKDAGSAQYRMQPIPLTDNQKDGRTVYCFEVNAKNSYGGYAGYKAVIGRATRTNGKIVSYIPDNDSGIPSSTADMCRAFGYSFQ